MDAQRREELARHAAGMIGVLQGAVEESWDELLPAARTWGPDSRARARAAARCALEGIVVHLVQGDLDEQAWVTTRDTVFGHGHASADEAAELLRTVRIVGVELLADGLTERAGLTHDERWELQQQATAFADVLLRRSDELDPAAIDAMLNDLMRSGPDLR